MYCQSPRYIQPWCEPVARSLCSVQTKLDKEKYIKSFLSCRQWLQNKTGPRIRGKHCWIMLPKSLSQWRQMCEQRLWQDLPMYKSLYRWVINDKEFLTLLLQYFSYSDIPCRLYIFFLCKYWSQCFIYSVFIPSLVMPLQFTLFEMY